MSKCTWKECKKEGNHPMISKDGEQWALLCEKHHAEMKNSLDMMFKEHAEKMEDK